MYSVFYLSQSDLTTAGFLSPLKKGMGRENKRKRKRTLPKLALVHRDNFLDFWALQAC